MVFWVFTSRVVATPDMPPVVDSDWVLQPAYILSEVEGTPIDDESLTCGGYMGVITVKAVGVAMKGCIFGTGKSVRLARYIDSNNTFSYAVAYPNDQTFYRVSGLCEGMARCGYGHGADTLLLQTLEDDSVTTFVLVRGFTKHLTKKVGDSAQFEFNAPQQQTYLVNNGYTLEVGDMSISTDGNWAVIELPQVGIIRLNLRTFENKRVADFNSLYTPNPRPVYTTISDDGRIIVVTGYSIDSLVIEARDACGDSITALSNAYFKNGTYSCSSTLLEFNILFPGQLEVYRSKFSPDGKRLISSIKRGTRYKTVTITPNWEASGPPLYLAFGDSFTSGEGELSDDFYINNTNTASNRCHVSSRSYPYLVSEAWQMSALNLACSGSRVEELVRASNTFAGNPLGAWPTILSLSVGGNDVDFMGKLKACIGVGTCEWAKDDKKKSTAKEIEALFPKVVATIETFKTTYTPTPVFVVGYPNVINGDPAAPCSPLVASLLDATERRYMSESIQYINQILSAAANYSQVQYIDAENAYSNERLCDEHETAMNAIRYGDDLAPIPMLGDFKFIGSESFHPTPRGHELMAYAVNSGLSVSWPSTLCLDCEFSESDLVAPVYWSENVDPSAPWYRQIAERFLDTELVTQTITQSFNFLPNTFLPESKVQLELHSDAIDLGEFTASGEGSLSGSFTLPAGITGFHTVHAYGESSTGDLLDMYQTVGVDTSSVDTNPTSPAGSSSGSINSGGEHTTKKGADYVSLAFYTAGNGNSDNNIGSSGHGSDDAIYNPSRVVGTSKVLGEQTTKNKTDPNELFWWYAGGAVLTGLTFLTFYIKKRQKVARVG